MSSIHIEQKTRWGIAACGKISHDFASCLKAMPEEHEVIACASNSSLDCAKEFATRFSIANAYGSYEELANDKTVQIVYIGALNTSHFGISKLMLNNGKHILVEKPLGMNQREVKAIFALAKDKKLFVMEGMWSRFLPSTRKLATELIQNSIGQVHSVNVTFGSKMSQKARIHDIALGGGVTLDIGVYAVYFMTGVFGFEDLQKVVAIGHKNDDGVDDCVSVSIRYSDKRMATLTWSGLVVLPNEAVVSGTEGSITLAKPRFHCAEDIVTPSGTHSFPLPECFLPCNYMNSAGLRYEAMEVRRCLQLGLLESPLLPHAETLAVHKVLDEVRQQVGVVYPADTADSQHSRSNSQSSIRSQSSVVRPKV